MPLDNPLTGLPTASCCLKTQKTKNVLLQASKVERNGLLEFSWFSLRTFYNVEFTYEAIIKKHDVPRSHFSNARKQAAQIRYFLLQAKEYFDASRTVTLVTRPVLLYYSVMCLAVAEFLFKQSGESSLDKARANHRHHGLIFTHRNNAAAAKPRITMAAAALIANPALDKNDRPFGTFELWRRTARGYPLTGTSTIHDRTTSSHTEGYGVLAACRDVPFPEIKSKGVTFLDVVKNIPGMVPLLNQFRLPSNLLRSLVNATGDKASGDGKTTIIIHPTPQNLFETFLSQCYFNANDMARIEYRELDSGGIIEMRVNYKTNSIVRFAIPNSTSDKHDNTWFYAEPEVTNEFGYLYLGLYMVGNYARYFPDFWIHDVEKHTELGVLIEYFMDVAEKRIGVLTLSELSEIFLVPG